YFNSKLLCLARSSIYQDSLHEQSWQKIQLIEAPKAPAPAAEAPTFQKPQFTQALNSVEAEEGGNALLECRIIPVNDPKLKIEWYLNDAPIPNSNRVMLTQDFGYISLQINHVLPHDIGVYMCRAVNELGEAVSTASLS